MMKNLRSTINRMSDKSFGLCMYGLGFLLGCGFIGMLWYCRYI